MSGVNLDEKIKGINCYVEHYEIMAHDVDAHNNAKPSVIVRLLQETANHHMRDRRPTYYELFSQGKSYILIRIKCEIVDRLHPYDKVDVATWTSVSKGATFKRNYLMSKDGKEVARAYSEWAVVDLNGGGILRVEDIDTSNFEVDEPIEMTLPTKFHFPSDAEFSECGSKEILYTDCDMNLHMNNTLYQDMLWNHIPDVENKILKGFTMRFMKEGTLGKTLKVLRAEGLAEEGNGTWFFKTMIEDGSEMKVNVEAMFKCSTIV